MHPFGGGAAESDAAFRRLQRGRPSAGRLPGTINHKDRAAPRPVTFEITGPRYDYRELLESVDDRLSGRIYVAGAADCGPLPEESEKAGGESLLPPITGEGGFDGFEGFVAGSPFPEDSENAGNVGFVGFVEGGAFPENAGSKAPESPDNAPKAASFEGGATPVAGEHQGAAPPLDPPTPPKEFPPAEISPIVTGCAWIRHCRNHAKVLPEPEWYAMLTVVGRCKDGERLAHAWSRPYANRRPADRAGARGPP